MLRLPPLNALRAFEAAARHSSIKHAAEELCVTPGAVSRHVLKLEKYLGVRLFDRRHGSVELTSAGAGYLEEIREAFVLISRATTTTRAGHDERHLRLRVPPTCAARWLVPRLAHFHAQHGDIAIEIATSHDAVDFARDEFDAAVHYGRAIAPGLAGAELFGEVLLPVCTPALASQPPPVRRPRDLAGHVLLHSIRRPNDWPDWFAAAGAGTLDLERTLAFENSTLTYQGAIDGLGVAVAQVAFVGDELERGQLVAPLDIRLHGECSYFLVYPREKTKLAKVRVFQEWITGEAERTRARLAVRAAA
jgi:LysR family transcriptional regulator, glycine cleavage system transcriptional activator